ncbi:MAG TPA: hypothetical protein VEZ70_12295 [Allosphingosinicella sp.]|nr:hypothetical protein [Allosphingosinicella sp.]
MAAVEGESAGLAFDAAEAGQAGYDAACSEWEEAVRGAMRAAAPDWRALALKVVLAVDADVGSLHGGEACLAALRGDAVRLGGAVG